MLATVKDTWNIYPLFKTTYRSRDRIPVRVKFSVPVQTGSGAHPAPYTMGTGSFPGIKRPGRGV